MGWGILFTLVMAIWGGGYKFLQKTDRNVKGPELDLFDNDYVWYLFVSLESAVKNVGELTLSDRCTWPTACLIPCGRCTATTQWGLCRTTPENWLTMRASISLYKQSGPLASQN